jgi:hypothetical protein
MVGFDFLRSLGLLTIFRTGPHTSDSESRKHITAHGFVGGRGRFTIHADPRGRCLDAFTNAGKLTGVHFDIDNNCEECS